MKTKTQYPLGVSYIAEHLHESAEIFKKEKPHKDNFIGLAVLEGSFLLDNAEEIYEALDLGERLCIKARECASYRLPALTVFRENGDELGNIPLAEGILPNILIQRGISVWCYAEAKSFKAGILEIAVSIYCENY